jgi:hypothetical protein
MPIVIQRLSLFAYRSITGLVLDGLTPVSLVVGANNSGKSSILEAAGLPLRPADANQWVSEVRQCDVDMALVDGLLSLFPELRKPAGAKKATLGVMAAIFKPGTPTQVSLEANRWVCEQTQALPCLRPCFEFLKALLGPLVEIRP